MVVSAILPQLMFIMWFNYKKHLQKLFLCDIIITDSNIYYSKHSHCFGDSFVVNCTWISPPDLFSLKNPDMCEMSGFLYL